MKARNVVSTVVLVLMVAAGTALASEGKDTETSETARNQGNACFFFNTIYNWQVLNDRSLVVWTNGEQDAYLVKLAFPSPDLPFAIDLGFNDADGNGLFCSYGGDSVIVRGAATMPNRLLVESISKLSKTQLQDLLTTNKATRGERHSVKKSEQEKPAS